MQNYIKNIEIKSLQELIDLLDFHLESNYEFDSLEYEVTRYNVLDMLTHKECLLVAKDELERQNVIIDLESIEEYLYNERDHYLDTFLIEAIDKHMN